MVFDTTGVPVRSEDAGLQGAKPTAACRRRRSTAIEKAFAGPKDSKGRQVYPGFLFDTGIASTQGIPGLLAGGSNPVGPAVHARPRWTSTRGRARAARSARDPDGDIDVDQPQHVLGPRRQADLLARRQRPVVLGARHDRLLRAHDEGERRRRSRSCNWSRLFLVARHGPLRWRSDGARHLRLLSAVVDWVENGTAPGRHRNRPRVSGAQPSALRVPAARALQGQGNPDVAENFECRE